MQKRNLGLALSMIVITMIPVTQTLAAVSQFAKNNRTASYKMSDINSDCNPCTNECKKADTKNVARVKSFYALLKKADYKAATKMLQTNKNDDLFGYLFPFCSAVHIPLAFSASHNGIIVFTVSGNGFPSVPNDSYFFGHIQLSGGKIVLKEKIIAHYFDNDKIEYKKALNSKVAKDYNENISKILKKIEDETKKGVETGVFNNKAVQAEYKKFVASVK